MSGSLSIDPRQADRSSILGVFASSSAINVTNASWHLSQRHKTRVSLRAAPPISEGFCEYAWIILSRMVWNFKGDVSEKREAFNKRIHNVESEKNDESETELREGSHRSYATMKRKLKDNTHRLLSRYHIIDR